MTLKPALAAIAILAAVCAAPARAQTAAPPPPAPPAPQTATLPAPPVPAALDAKIRQLLALTGAAKMGQQAMDQMLAAMKPSFPKVPEAFWDMFRSKSNGDDLISLIVPIYAKYYTPQDIDGLIAFYQTPLGQKVVAALPDIAHDSMAAGQAWGQQKAHDVINELQKAHAAAAQPPVQ